MGGVVPQQERLRSSFAPFPEQGAPATASSIEIAELRTDEMKRTAEYMQRICATGVNVRSENVGCTCAPPFDACPPTPGTTLARQDVVYPFYTRVEGAFTGPQAREVALFGGCDPPQDHCRGLVLVDLADAATTRRAPEVRADVEASQCSTFRTPRGNDRLVCRALQYRDREKNQEIFAYDFANATAPRVSLYTARDNVHAACFTAAQRPIVAQKVVDFFVRDTNGDAITDVVIELASRQGKVTEAFNESCKCTMTLRAERCPSTRVPADFLSAPERRTLTFLGKSDGTFAPTPETANAIRAMK